MGSYKITIEVRTDWGQVIKGDPNFETSYPDMSFDIEAWDLENLEAMMRSQYRTLKAWMPERLIEMYASVPNTIGGTWMVMHSLRPRKEGLEFLNH